MLLLEEFLSPATSNQSHILSENEIPILLYLHELRFHNYVVEQLAVINEGGRFTKPRDNLPQEMAGKAWAKYDNDLFQTGRL